jgi:predicted nucleic acid-binding protein
MPSEPPKIYWDACVPLSYINGMPDRVQHIEPMMEKSGTDFQIITSVLSITEVAFAKMEQDKKVLEPEIERRIKLLWEAGSPIKIVEFYELIAFRAQRLIRAALEKSWQLKPADAIHLATADQLAVKEFNTYDDGLEKFAELTDTKFKVCPPTSVAPHLPLVASVASVPPNEKETKLELSNSEQKPKEVAVESAETKEGEPKKAEEPVTAEIKKESDNNNQVVKPSNSEAEGPLPSKSV